jgi:hypothetical protein
MYTHSLDPSKPYAILRKIRGSRDQAITGYFAPQEQIPWVRGCWNWRLLLYSLVDVHDIETGLSTQFQQRTHFKFSIPCVFTLYVTR